VSGDLGVRLYTTSCQNVINCTLYPAADSFWQRLYGDGGICRSSVFSFWHKSSKRKSGGVPDGVACGDITLWCSCTWFYVLYFIICLFLK